MENSDVNLGHYSSGPARADYDTTGAATVTLDRLRILQDILLVRPILETETPHGLILPDVGDAQKVRRGVVVKCGPGKHNGETFVPMTAKVGDIAYFGKYASPGEPIKINGETFLLFRIGDLFAIEPADAIH